MKKLLALLLILPLSELFAADLMGLYEQALENDPVLRAARSSRNSVAESRPQAIAQMLPQLSLSGKASRTERFTRNPLTNPFSPPPKKNVTFNSKEASVTLQQALVHFDHWIQLDQSKYSIARADAEYDAEELNLMLRVAQSYFNILAAQDTLTFTRAELRAISRQLEQARQRFDVGLIAITDVHEVQAAYDQAKANEITALNDLDGGWEALREIVGDYGGRSLRGLRGKIPMSKPDPQSIEEWTRTAMARNPTVLAASNASEVARKQIKLQRSGHLPTLDLVAVGNTLETEASSGDVDNSSISLQLSLPVFAGGGVVSRTRQARHDFQTATERQEQSRRAVRREVSDAYRGVVSTISRVRALQSATRSANSALAATKAGFDVGTRTMVDVLDVQRNLFRARRDYSRARYDYIINGLKLKKAAGTLRVDDLRLVNSLLRG